MKVSFKFLVFQNGVLAEELGSEQEFTDAQGLAQALAKFAAQESGVRLDPQVRPIYTSSGPAVELPSARDGYGSTTNVVIQEMSFS